MTSQFLTMHRSTLIFSLLFFSLARTKRLLAGIWDTALQCWDASIALSTHKCLERSRIQPIPRGKQSCGYFLLSRKYKSIFLGFFEVCFFFFKISVKAVLESCYCMCSLCRTCKVISCSYFLISQEGFSSCSRFLGISVTSLLPGVAVPSACALACRLEELFPQKLGKLLQFCQLSPWKGLFIPFQQRHWEILAPTGVWLFTVIPPSFLSRIFALFWC